MRNLKTIGAALVATVALSLGAGAAYAAPINPVTDSGAARQAALPKDSVTGPVQIKDGTVYGADLAPNMINWFTTVYNGSVHEIGLDAALKAKVNAPDKDSLATAHYAVAYYDEGDTNAGAIATVSCQKETDTAVSGGVQTVGLDATANSRNTPVNSSFPGRMDWTTNTPKIDRLDGWIVQFGGNAGTVSDKAPEKVKVWALCVSGVDVPVIQTYTQSADN